ncbi:hypothetical protein COO60DRAFT_933260 [Scenedesmus sp. NREL 46B-D3]|nr:hypothetical protein COO60DRAFT_933260 [Scenedesmus sp. NREL 46B-D3]
MQCLRFCRVCAQRAVERLQRSPLGTTRVSTAGSMKVRAVVNSLCCGTLLLYSQFSREKSHSRMGPSQFILSLAGEAPSLPPLLLGPAAAEGKSGWPAADSTFCIFCSSSGEMPMPIWRACSAAAWNAVTGETAAGGAGGGAAERGQAPAAAAAAAGSCGDAPLPAPAAAAAAGLGGNAGGPAAAAAGLNVG